MGLNLQAENNCTLAPALAIASSTAFVKTTNTFAFKVNGNYSPAVTTQNPLPSLALATRNRPFVQTGAGIPPAIVNNQIVGGVVAGTLASDDGTVSATTNSCRMYTLCADLQPNELATPVFYWIAGDDFPKHRSVGANDIAHPTLSTSAEIGYVYIKNEQTSPTVFTPGTTALTGVSGLTVTYSDNYAKIGA